MNHRLLHSPFTETLHDSKVLYLAITDIDGRILHVNQLFHTYFLNAESNENFTTCLIANDFTNYLETIRHCLEQPGIQFPQTYIHQQKVKKQINWEIFANLDENRQVEGIVHIGHEISLNLSSADALKLEFPFGLDNEKIRSVVNHIPGAIYRCRGDENITLEFFSDEIVKVSGYPMNYFLNDRTGGYSNLVFGEDKDVFDQMIRKAILNRSKYELEYRIKHKDGSVKWVFESGQANMDQGDGMVYIDGCIFDINRRKMTESALANSKAEVKRLALVAENTTNSVMITDAEGYIIWINEGYTRVSGYSLDEIRGKKIGYSLDGVESDKDMLFKIRERITMRLPYKEELVSHHKDGHPIWLEVDCQPMYDEQGKHIGFMSIENDITQKKVAQKEQAELLQRLRLATDSAEIGIFEIDMHTNEVIWDDKMYEIYGQQRDPSLNLYKVYFHAIHPDDSAMMAKVISELLTQKKEVDGAIYRIILPDKRVRYIESHAIIKKSDVGRVISLIGTNRDITEAVLVQEKIKAQNKVLREIAIIQSHEVRRPLANILGVIEILQNSGALKDLEIFDLLVESAKDLDMQIRAIVNKANEMDDEVFR